MRNKFQSTDRVGYTLEIVALSMGKIIHWISVPFGTSAMMRSLDNTIDDRITEMHIRISHVQLSTKNHTSLHCLRSVHLIEEFEIFFYRTITVWAGSSRSCRSSLLSSNFLSSLLINICMTLLNHPNRKVPQFLKIVGSVVNISPFETQPLDVLEDIFYIFIILLAWICIIKAEITDSVVFIGNTKVHTDGLSMTYMKIAIWFRWETSLYASTIFTFL